jgi:diguanylate cyclase (GGDEF)-like protein
MLLRLIASVLAQLPAISDEYIHTTELGTEYAWAGYGLVLGAVGVHPGLTMPRQRQRPSSGGLSVGRLALYIGLALIAPISWIVELVRNSGDIGANPLGFGVPAVSSALLLVVLVVRLGLISRVLQRRVDELGGRSVELSAAVTDLRQLQQELTFRVTHDSLTGLSSREVLIERLGQVSRQTDEFVGYALILLDLDGFKDVNDSMGHPAGDALLLEVGRRIRQTAPPEATPARLGGDEFAVLLERVKPDAARRYARTTLAAVGRFYSIVGRELVISASVGVLIIEPRQPRPTPSDMLRDVDLALYAAKNAGKNRMVTFEPGLRLSNRAATTTAAPDGTGSGL